MTSTETATTTTSSSSLPTGSLAAETTPQTAANHTSSHDDEEEEDDDEKPPNRHALKKMLWRFSPEESHSDWTIELVIQENSEELIECNDDQKHITKERDADPKEDILIYHVHKCVLSVGDRSCEYFARLFTNDHFAEAARRTSRIPLPRLAANAFPFMLDYIYQCNEPLVVETETATALHFLGQYFENRELRWDAKQFWKTDLTLANCHVYYEHAKVFRDEKIINAVAKTCENNFHLLEPSSPIVMVADPEFFLKIMEHSTIEKEDSLRVSKLVAEVCNLSHKNLKADLFWALTNENFIPIIHLSVATDFLRLHNLYQEGDQAFSALSSLQVRCADALAKSWRYIATSEDATTTDFLKSQPPIIISEVMKQALRRADQLVSRLEMTCPCLWSKDYKDSNHAVYDSIIVSGAGISELDGRYHHAIHINGACCFQMEGMWQDTRRMFSIVKWTDGRWYISIIRVFDFYSATGTRDNQMIPPRVGWLASTHGVSPAPTLEYHAKADDT